MQEITAENLSLETPVEEPENAGELTTSEFDKQLQMREYLKSQGIPTRGWKLGKCSYCGAGDNKIRTLSNGSFADNRTPTHKLPNKLWACLTCYLRPKRDA